MGRVATLSPAVPQSFTSIKTNGKADEDFRIYDESSTPARVIDHYRDMRQNQTVEFYKRMERKYDFSNGAYRSLLTIEEAFAELGTLLAYQNLCSFSESFF